MRWWCRMAFSAATKPGSSAGTPSPAATSRTVRAPALIAWAMSPDPTRSVLVATAHQPDVLAADRHVVADAVDRVIEPPQDTPLVGAAPFGHDVVGPLGAVDVVGDLELDAFAD